MSFGPQDRCNDRVFVMRVLYEIQATAIGGRDGAAATSDGALRVDLAIPRELGGPGDEGANPEQLFALGYAACFLTAIREAASESQTKIAPDTNVTATVGIGPRDGGDGLALSVALMIDLPGVARETAQSLVHRAHEICPYSHATRGTLDVRLRVA
jgi:lipoyl-dependent peroxiredoxin